jgi:hypothetical protein
MDWNFKIGDEIEYSKCYSTSNMERFNNYNRFTGNYGDAKPITFYTICQHCEKCVETYDYNESTIELLEDEEDELGEVVANTNYKRLTGSDLLERMKEPPSVYKRPDKPKEKCNALVNKTGKAFVTGWTYKIMSDYYYSAARKGYDVDDYEQASASGKREKILLCKDKPSGKEFIVRTCDAEKIEEKEINNGI